MFSFKINPLFIVVFLLFMIVGMFEEILVAFILVFLHEMTHSLIALKLGYKVKKIELFPFGGMAEYKGLLEMEPWHEIIISLSGPMLNFFLAGLFLFFYNIGNYTQGFMINQICPYNLIIKYNIILGCFNLIPALPLDGGRILRGFLVSRIGFKKGSFLAVKVAKILAVIGFILGIIALILQYSNIWFLLIAFFVYGATVKEEKQVLYCLLTYLSYRKQYIEKFDFKNVRTQVVKGSIGLKIVISYLIPNKFNIFYVLDENSSIAGTISETKLLEEFFSLEKCDKQIIEIVD